MKPRLAAALPAFALFAMGATAQDLHADRNGDPVEQFLYYQSAASAEADTATQALEDGDLKTACAALEALQTDSFQASLLLGPIMKAVRTDEGLDEATREDELQQLRDYDQALNDMWDTASHKWDQYCT